jgi:hypothetical protein
VRQSAFTDDYRGARAGPATDALAAHVKPLEAWLAKRWTRAPSTPPRSSTPGAPVLLHGHCQQKAVLGTAATKAVLGWTSRDVREVDAGCCGMAGSFGYTHHDLSMRSASSGSSPPCAPTAGDVVASGFSCRHQVADATGVRPRHVVETLAGALRRRPSGRPRKRTAQLQAGGQHLLVDVGPGHRAELDDARRRQLRQVQHHGGDGEDAVGPEVGDGSSAGPPGAPTTMRMAMP